MFVLFGEKGHLAKLQSYGYKTFAPHIDESYDEESNFNLRIQAMFNSYEKFLSEEHSIDEIKIALEHNFNMIHDSYWVSSRLVDPMRLIITRIDENIPDD